MTLPDSDAARIIRLPRIDRPEGAITPVQGGLDVPFEIRRIYYLYDIVAGASRGGHAHRKLQSVIVAVMGGVSVAVDDGVTRQRFDLRRGDEGLYIPPMVWRELDDFAGGTVCVVLASRSYESEDYIKDYREFEAERRQAMT